MMLSRPELRIQVYKQDVIEFKMDVPKIRKKEDNLLQDGLFGS